MSCVSDIYFHKITFLAYHSKVVYNKLYMGKNIISRIIR